MTTEPERRASLSAWWAKTSDILLATASGIEHRLADETADRQSICEDTAGWLRAIARSKAEPPAGYALLDPVQLETVKRALGDAIDYQTAVADAWCPNCDKTGDGLCDGHAAWLTRLQE